MRRLDGAKLALLLDGEIVDRIDFPSTGDYFKRETGIPCVGPGQLSFSSLSPAGTKGLQMLMVYVVLRDDGG